ncbi:MAG: response regulator [Phycisphaerales bacterium]
MTDDRPKLLLLGGPHIDADAIAPSLTELYEVIEADPSDAMRTIDACQVVFAEAGDFAALERELVGRQSTLLLNAISEGVALAGPDGRILWRNDRFATLDPQVARRVSEVVTHAFAVFRGALNGDRDPEQLREKKYRVAHKRTKKVYEARICPITLQAGDRDGAAPAKIAQVAVVVRDATSKARNEQRLDAIERAGRELAHLDPDHVKRLHAAERLRELEQRVRRCMRELLHFDHFAIRAVQEGKGDEPAQLPVIMAHGIPERYQQIKLSAAEQGSGIMGHVAATGRSYVCDDCTVDPLYVDALDTPGSSITVPLRAHNRLIGVLNIESTQKHSFSKNDLRAAEIFGGYLATALHTLDLLVAERVETNRAATGVVRGELTVPLNDLCEEVAILREQAGGNRAVTDHLDRILADVESIRKRIRSVSRGPNTMLGAQDFVEFAKADPALQGKRVLVVDNEEEIRDIMRDVLTAAGCVVLTCEDGVSATRTLAAQRFDGAGDAPGAQQPFDLVLSDIGLDDMSGYDVFAKARKANARVPVILVTGFGYDPHHSIVKASQEGLQAVLFKPFQAQRLIDEVKDALAEKDEDAPEG